MNEESNFHSLIRKRADEQLLFLPHAIRQMSRPDRMFTPAEIQAVIQDGEIIENYPEDARDHSALLVGQGADGRFVHVVCSPKDEYLAIITAYIPDPSAWTDDYKMRKNP